MNQESRIKKISNSLFIIYNSGKSRGFTLVESLVAISIVLVSIVGPLTIISKTLSYARFARDEITAFYLAQDAIEFVRNKRDNNVIAGNNWLSGLSACTSGICAIDSAANAVLSCGASCDPLKISSSGIYGYVGGENSTFVREISLTETSGNREATIDVTVGWSQGPFRRNFTIREYIFNWQEAIVAQPPPPPETGPDSYTVLQSSFDGVDGSTIFFDDTGRHIIIGTGDAQIDTAQSKFGGASLFLDGSGDYLSVSDSADFDFSGKDTIWTIEAFVRFPSLPGWKTIFGQMHSSMDKYMEIAIDFVNGIGLSFMIVDGSQIVRLDQGNTAGWALDTWYHVAVEKSGATYRLYRDGVVLNSTTDPDTAFNYDGTVFISGIGVPFTPTSFIGWVDEYRISKGITRYGGAFTPPSAPF